MKSFGDIGRPIARNPCYTPTPDSAWMRPRDRRRSWIVRCAVWSEGAL